MGLRKGGDVRSAAFRQKIRDKKDVWDRTFRGLFLCVFTLLPRAAGS